MAVLVASDIIQVTIRGRWSNGHPVCNVLHYRIDGVWIGVDIEAAVEDIIQNWQSQLMGGFRNNYTLEDAAWMDLRSADGATGVIAPDPAEPLTGGSTGDSAPPNCSLLVHKRTASARGTRSGRMYLPPPGEGDVDENGNISTTLIPLLNADLATFLANTTQGEPPFEVSDTNRYLVVLHSDATNSRVTSLQCDGVLASQRRRNR